MRCIAVNDNGAISIEFSNHDRAVLAAWLAEKAEMPNGATELLRYLR
jgi:hypothetical protein